MTVPRVLEFREPERIGDHRISAVLGEGGQGRVMGTATIGDMLTTARARQQYRYGFGLRGTTGTIGITRTEGRSAQD
ncbi:hypothetical protein [Nonomuraea sp. NPDC049141]|uniref:hypothetical protein n=1 Tax=unclassified Nonomuraea TaxID=2593643 RepID=UPI0033EA29EC